MKILNSSLLTWIGLFLTPLILGAQDVKLNEFLQLAKNHPTFNREAIQVEIAEKTRDAFHGAEDWNLFSSPYYVAQDVLAGGAFAPESIDQLGLGIGSEKTFWNTGGRLSMAWNYEQTEQHGLQDIEIPNIISIPAGPNMFYQNKLSVTYTQPLLQNFRGNLDRLGFDMSQLSLEMVKIQELENNEDFLLSLSLQFIEWALLTEQKAIASERLELALQQLEQIQHKRTANLVDEIDVLRAQDAVHLAQQGTVLISAQWVGKQFELATLLKAPDLKNQSPQFDLYAINEPQDPGNIIQQLKGKSRILDIISKQSAQLIRHEIATKELTRAQLHLTTQVGLVGGSEKSGDAFGFDGKDLGMFLQYSYPLGNTKAVRELEKVQLQVKQINYAREEAELSLESAARNLLIQIEELEKALEINKQQLETGKLKTAAELKRYNQGRSDLSFVIQSQDNEQNAKLSYAQNAALYHSLNFRLKAILDEINPGTGTDHDTERN